MPHHRESRLFQAAFFVPFIEVCHKLLSPKKKKYTKVSNYVPPVKVKPFGFLKKNPSIISENVKILVSISFSKNLAIRHSIACFNKYISFFSLCFFAVFRGLIMSIFQNANSRFPHLINHTIKIKLFTQNIKNHESKFTKHHARPDYHSVSLFGLLSKQSRI